VTVLLFLTAAYVTRIDAKATSFDQFHLQIVHVGEIESAYDDKVSVAANRLNDIQSTFATNLNDLGLVPSARVQLPMTSHGKEIVKFRR